VFHGPSLALFNIFCTTTHVRFITRHSINESREQPRDSINLSREARREVTREESREQRTESREQREENREQRADRREH
jgi:hypothetical protein